jgi:hypothetical protein
VDFCERLHTDPFGDLEHYWFQIPSREMANFQPLRRAHASLGREVGVDPKVAADQRGQGFGWRGMFAEGSHWIPEHFAT